MRSPAMAALFGWTALPPVGRSRRAGPRPRRQPTSPWGRPCPCSPRTRARRSPPCRGTARAVDAGPVRDAFGPDGRFGGSLSAADVRLVAPAKLTCSLRVTGVRGDGFHLLDAEMVTLDLADDARARPDRRRPRGRRGPGGLDVAADGGNLGVPGAGAGRSASPGCASSSGSRPAAGSAEVPRTPPRSCAGPARRPRPGGGARRRRALLPGRRPGPGHRHRRADRAAPVSMPDVHPAHAAVRLLDPGGLPGLGRPGRTHRGGPERPGARGAAGRAPTAAWRDRLGDATGETPVLAGSGITWFVPGPIPGDDRVVVRTTGRLS